MTIGRKKRDFKLNYGITISLNAPDRIRVWFFPYIYIWCFKLHTLPINGEALQKNKHYKGINWSYDFLSHWNIIMYRKSFRLLGKWRHIDFPIKISYF